LRPKFINNCIAANVSVWVKSQTIKIKIVFIKTVKNSSLRNQDL
jgi:hypothetical protein